MDLCFESNSWKKMSCSLFLENWTFRQRRSWSLFHRLLSQTSWLRANFPVKKVRLFQILCLTWMHIKLRDGVVLPSVCNSVIPGETVLHPFGCSVLGVLAMWTKEVDFFQPLVGPSRRLYWTAFFTNTVALHLVLIWRESSLLLNQLLGVGFLLV